MTAASAAVAEASNAGRQALGAAPYLTVADLRALCAAIGITLTEVADDTVRTPLYVMVSTREPGRTLYVGKSTGIDADLQRGGSEDGWTSFEPAPTDYLVGFQRCVALNGKDRHRLAYSADPGAALAAAARSWVEQWPLPDLANPAVVELLLIRIHVLCGVPIANSAGAGQWDASWGTGVDRLAETAIMAAGYDDWRSARGPKPVGT